jgi:hypothetical protein
MKILHKFLEIHRIHRQKFSFVALVRNQKPTLLKQLTSQSLSSNLSRARHPIRFQAYSWLFLKQQTIKLVFHKEVKISKKLAVKTRQKFWQLKNSSRKLSFLFPALLKLKNPKIFSALLCHNQGPKATIYREQVILEWVTTRVKPRWYQRLTLDLRHHLVSSVRPCPMLKWFNPGRGPKESKGKSMKTCFQKMCSALEK